MAQRGLVPAKGVLNREHWFLLMVLGVADFFQGYDSFVVTAALPQIRETFSLTQSQASLWLTIPILGAIPAVYFSRRADIEGRRRLLTVSIVGFTLLTGATAVAPSISWFVSLQFFAYLFLTVEGALAWTMVAEELPAEARGFGFGWLAMLTAVGSGFASIFYGALFVPLGISWRWLYVIALPPLATIALVRRRLPESRRFAAAQQSGRLASRWHEILKPPIRRWLILVCITALLGALTTQAGVFTIDFLQDDRNIGPTAANLILVAAGALAVPVLVLSGSLSDRYGRKLIGCSFGLLSIVGGLWFFLVARGALALFFSLALVFIGQFGSWPTLGAFGSELFPTAHRALAGAWSNIARVLGQSISFLLGSVLIDAIGELSITSVILGIGPLLSFLLIWLVFPETKGRELEEISGEAPLPFVTPTPLEAGGLVLESILEEPQRETPRDQPSPSEAGTTED
jgi:MFS transporter, putative metabolite:H+ symporter